MTTPELVFLQQDKITGSFWENVKAYREEKKMKYDVIIIGAGPGGIFSAYELVKKNG